MQRRKPEFGDEGFIPVELIRNGTDAAVAGPACKTLWETISLININVPVTVSCFTLAASPILATGSLMPCKQRLQPFRAAENLAFWRGEEIEQAIRAADRAAARAARLAADRARGGGPGGLGDRAPGDLDAAAVALLDDETAGAVRDEEDFDDGVRAEMAIAAADVAAGMGSDVDGHVVDPFDLAGEEAADTDDDDRVPIEGALAAVAGLAEALGVEIESDGGSSAVSSIEGGVLKCKIPVGGWERDGRLHVTHIGDRLEFYAVCPCHTTEMQCRRTRTARAGKRGAQGRPLGNLVAWIKGGAAFTSKDNHMKWTPARDVRVAGRELLRGKEEGPFFFALERDKREGEESEPEGCP